MDEQKAVIANNTERKVLMLGDYVGICWNGHYVRQGIAPIMGEYCIIKKWELRPTRWTPGPYIDFVQLHEDPDGETYENEDSPVESGLSPEVARHIAAELIKAAEYIEANSRAISPALE